LPVVPVCKHCAVNNLRFEFFHGMEEVVGSIPTRSTKPINLASSPSRDFVAFLSQIPKPLRGQALKPLLLQPKSEAIPAGMRRRF
jgi:hypothetical protein